MQARMVSPFPQAIPTTTFPPFSSSSTNIFFLKITKPVWSEWVLETELQGEAFSLSICPNQDEHYQCRFLHYLSPVCSWLRTGGLAADNCWADFCDRSIWTVATVFTSQLISHHLCEGMLVGILSHCCCAGRVWPGGLLGERFYSHIKCLNHPAFQLELSICLIFPTSFSCF